MTKRYGILLEYRSAGENLQKVLCNEEPRCGPTWFDGKRKLEWSWEHLNSFTNPYTTEFKWNVRCKLDEIKKEYPDLKLTIIEFEEERLQQLLFNRIKLGY